MSANELELWCGGEHMLCYYLAKLDVFQTHITAFDTLEHIGWLLAKGEKPTL